MLGIIIACGILVLAVILAIVLLDIHRLRINTKKVHDELLEIRAKLDALQSHM
jgi:CHASE3 domain sensor protein